MVSSLARTELRERGEPTRPDPMATYDDLTPEHRRFLERYAFRTLDPTPCARLEMPLASARVALVSTAGLTHRDDRPFGAWRPGGDASFRWLATDVDLEDLRIHHRSEAFDATDALLDKNLVWPRDRLRELARDGRIGALVERHPSFMGSITAPARLIRTTAPEAAAALRSQGTDLVLFAPA